MYYVYDYEGYYVAKTDSWKWAKRMADANAGYIKEWSQWDDELLIGTSLTGTWDYTSLNHFIMGYGKATKKLQEQNRVLLEALLEIVEELPAHTRMPITTKIKEIAQTALNKVK